MVPAYRAGDTIGRTLHALRMSRGIALDEVVVVCTRGDDSARVAVGFERVRVIEAPTRLSAGAARNLGACSLPDADVLMFVDADCAPRGDCLSDLLAELLDGRADLCAAMVSNAGPGLVAWLRHALEFKEADVGRPHGQADFVPSATMACRRDLFESVGGFPDMWPGEDLVFCHRVRTRGARVAFCERAVTEHVHPRGWRRMFRHQFDLGFTSAKARLVTGMRGAVFARFPIIAPLLVFGRAWRAMDWFFRYRRRDLPALVAAMPLYVLALGVWSAGFVSGSIAPSES